MTRVRLYAQAPRWEQRAIIYVLSPPAGQITHKLLEQLYDELLVDDMDNFTNQKNNTHYWRCSKISFDIKAKSNNKNSAIMSSAINKKCSAISTLRHLRKNKKHKLGREGFYHLRGVCSVVTINICSLDYAYNLQLAPMLLLRCNSISCSSSHSAGSNWRKWQACFKYPLALWITPSLQNCKW